MLKVGDQVKLNEEGLKVYRNSGDIIGIVENLSGFHEGDKIYRVGFQEGGNHFLLESEVYIFKKHSNKDLLKLNK